MTTCNICASILQILMCSLGSWWNTLTFSIADHVFSPFFPLKALDRHLRIKLGPAARECRLVKNASIQPFQRQPGEMNWTEVEPPVCLPMLGSKRTNFVMGEVEIFGASKHIKLYIYIYIYIIYHINVYIISYIHIYHIDNTIFNSEWLAGSEDFLSHRCFQHSCGAATCSSHPG